MILITLNTPNIKRYEHFPSLNFNQVSPQLKSLKTSELVKIMFFISLTNDLSRWLIWCYRHSNRFNGLFSNKNIFHKSLINCINLDCTLDIIYLMFF